MNDLWKVTMKEAGREFSVQGLHHREALQYAEDMAREGAELVAMERMSAPDTR